MHSLQMAAPVPVTIRATSPLTLPQNAQGSSDLVIVPYQSYSGL